MKKAYLAPTINSVEIETSSMIANSLQTHDETVNSKSEGVQLGKENRNSWDNIWSN